MILSSIPHARDNPPWSFSGDPDGPNFGRVFRWAGALGSTALTFDPRGRHHALTLFRGAELAPQVVIAGRRFDVVSAPSRGALV